MVGALRPGKEKAQEDYWIEGLVDGFPNLRLGVRVSRTGSKKWMARYRVGGRGTKDRRVTLGAYGDPKNGLLDYQAAVKAALKIHTATESGEDPAAKQKREKQTKIQRGESVEWLIDQFMKRYAEPNCGEDTVKSYKSYFDNWIKPAIGNQPCGSVTKSDLIELFNAITDGNKRMWPGKAGSAKMAERIRIHCGILFNWAASEDLIEYLPS